MKAKQHIKYLDNLTNVEYKNYCKITNKMDSR